MDTINGLSPDLYIKEEDTYEANGGIALFSSGDETFTGGSDTEGSITQVARIYWTITRTAEGIFTGGITGIDWYFNNPSSPFNNEMYNTEQKIWDYLSGEGNGNLDAVFITWNSSLSDRERLLFIVNFLSEDCYQMNFG